MKIVATRSLLKILTMLEHRTQPLDQIENSSKLPNYCYTAKSIEQNFPNFQLSLQLNMPDQRENVELKCGKVESPFFFREAHPQNFFRTLSKTGDPPPSPSGHLRLSLSIFVEKADFKAKNTHFGRLGTPGPSPLI